MIIKYYQVCINVLLLYFVEFCLRFSSISSKYDCSSTETLSSAINKYYDKSTKSSNVCSSDLEMLEKQILKSQQELNDLKSLGTLYE